MIDSGWAHDLNYFTIKQDARESSVASGPYKQGVLYVENDFGKPFVRLARDRR